MSDSPGRLQANHSGWKPTAQNSEFGGSLPGGEPASKAPRGACAPPLPFVFGTFPDTDTVNTDRALY